MPYQLTEPHPTVKSYAHSGRGGAGNYHKVPKTSNGSTARGPASLFEHGLPQTSSSKFSAGRGGAGNIHNSSERPIFSFDEELERQASREQKMKEGDIWHVGRGGAGNWIASGQATSRKDSTSSADSTHSGRSGFFGRISDTFSDRH